MDPKKRGDKELILGLLETPPVAKAFVLKIEETMGDLSLTHNEREEIRRMIDRLGLNRCSAPRKAKPKGKDFA